jgi:3-oxoacyl-[acyl-carrier-protein] synthase-1
MNFRSHVSGQIKINLQESIDRKFLRFMGDGASYNYLAMLEALKDSGLEENEISNPMTALIMGSGGPSTKNLLRAFDITRKLVQRKLVQPAFLKLCAARILLPYLLFLKLKV